MSTFNPEQLAALTGLTKATVLRYIRRKKLKAKRVRGYVIEGEAVRELLAQIAANPRVHKRKPVIG